MGEWERGGMSFRELVLGKMALYFYLAYREQCLACIVMLMGKLTQTTPEFLDENYYCLLVASAFTFTFTFTFLGLHVAT